MIHFVSDLRRFMMDYLLPRNQFPPFAPDAVVAAALTELQLNHSGDSISWIEFKVSHSANFVNIPIFGFLF